ncbi:MaoC family dehydratase [Halovenus halobia]|uniref:MaoC family dehydratase n=1 Tax=Halovenus halobia TaxID=3396622 RepID=UPI003F56F7EC
MSKEIPTAADLDVGDTGPEPQIEEVERRDFVKYAGSSGDFNPIHYDQRLANMAGYDGVFAQGMLTAGFAVQAVTDWFGIENIESYGVRFESQVWPEDTVTAVAEIVDIDVDGEGATVETELSVTNQDGEEVLSGEATATIPAE